MKTKTIYLFLSLFLLVYCPLHSGAYSVLSHEAIIDANWDKSIQPLLLKKYPGATKEQLKEARSYAYGGAVVPDMGYFPFGNKLFTNLIHYVRSGDFIVTLLDEAQDINEYAFALGALSHYYSDNYGHPLAVNRSVPVVYPKVKAKYGDNVTYAQDHLSHIRMEFGFDVLQTARGNYVSQSYHDFIGFNVARPVLERAFLKTYGLDINALFADLSLSISTFRWSVKNLFPGITKAAWILRKAEIKKSRPGIDSRHFTYKMRRAQYYHEFGKKRERPGVFASMLSATFRVLPKRVILRSLRFKEPSAQAEKLFVQSFDAVLLHYAEGIQRVASGHYNFPNRDFDTGKETAKAEYPLTDETYNDLVLALQKKDFERMSPALKQNILAFYGERGAKKNGDKSSENNEQVKEAVQDLRRH